MNVPCVLILGDFDAGWLAGLAGRYRLVAAGAAEIIQCEAVLLRSPYRVDAELLATAPALRHIIRAGSGVDNIDLAATRARGIEVHTTPAAATSVAEHAFALLFAVARDIPYLHQQTVAGLWRKSQARGIEINGKRLAVVGFGRVGREIGRIAQAFGMRVSVVDPSPEKPEKQAALAAMPGARLQVLEAALSGADVVMLSCPAPSDRRPVLDADRLALLPSGAIVINVARGSVLDHHALERALKSGHLVGAGLDVHLREPTDRQSWHLLPGVVVTPHVGAQTRETQTRVGEKVERLLELLFGRARAEDSHG